MHRFLVCAFVFTATACAGSAGQIELRGPDPDLAALAGDWQGDYQGLETGRTGQIHFSLELGRHTAEGQVFMGPSQTPLKISFVAVKQGEVSGKIEPYVDPSCSCEVETQFNGQYEGRLIDGTFTTRVVKNGAEMHGTWKVARADS